MEKNKEMNKSNENLRIRIVEVTPKTETAEDFLPRFTRTGKISYAKTRVYTQRYRKEWENMTDFKDWLSSVPDQNTKAYCKFCERTLHAHRLSLLKHMCTLKHQRAAAQIQREQLNESSKRNISHEIDEIVEDNEDYEECSYIVENEEMINDGEMEETIEESDNQEESPVFKKLKTEQKSDSLDEALEYINSDQLSENNSEINLQSESSDHNQDNIVYIKGSPQEEGVQSDNDHTEEESPQKSGTDSKTSKNFALSSKGDKPVTVDNSKKMIILTSNGKPFTIVKGPQILLNSSNNHNISIAKVTSGNPKIKISSQSASSPTVSRIPNNANLATNVSTLLKQKSNIISTYVLDTSKGIPVSGMQVMLYKLQDGKWTTIAESMTNANGICDDFAMRRNILSGRYKLHFEVEKYYNLRKIATIYPFIEIVFDIKNPNLSYYTPLYLSPYSYSTFKDTSR